MYFWNYWLRKTWSDNCLKSALSKDPWTSNIVNGCKLCWSPNDSSFTIFIDHCEGIWVEKSSSSWLANSWYWLLTHWLPMKGILFLIETIYCNQIHMHLSQKKRIFSHFFPPFSKPILNLKNFEKKRWTSYLMYFRNYGLQKMWLDNCLKKAILEHSSRSNMVNKPKHFWNLNESAFAILIDQCEGNWHDKGLS